MNSNIAMRTTVKSQTVLASFHHEAAAETAVQMLASNGIPTGLISVIALHDDGILRHKNEFSAASSGVTLTQRAARINVLKFFVFPNFGTLAVSGAMSHRISSAIRHNGLAALVNALTEVGVPPERAERYREDIRTGTFIILVQGSSNSIALAREVLDSASASEVQTYV